MDYLHLIITDIVFETSEPIALHFVDQDVTDDFVDFLAQSPTIGIHSFATDSPSWQSVLDYDSYFDKFKVYTDLVTHQVKAITNTKTFFTSLKLMTGLEAMVTLKC